MNQQQTTYCLISAIIGLTLSGCVQRDSQSSSPPAQNNITDQTQTQTATKTENAEEKLWSQLQEAETHYFVLMRHAIAPGTGDPANFELGDCSTQRNLSEEGRQQARRTGEAFQQREIEINQVLSSQWCRCLDTAKLMDIGTVKPLPALNSFFRDRSTQSEQTAQVREFILEQPETPGVTVMVTHFVNISALTGNGVSSGEMVVMQVNQQEELDVLGRIDAF
ncbi:MAG: histidine phosphatase family protein [Cyanobacteria bacterium]|jgi:phosphohistidine phosphatase SixA|nr:histidine phosphatase family protein [Cyanobacteria bacterium GSL.Bin21]